MNCRAPVVLLDLLCSICLAAAESAPEKAPEAPLFAEVPSSKSGLVFEHRLVEDHPSSTSYHSGYACGGVALGDIDGDKRPDIFLASGPDKNALFLNKGALHFEKAADRGVDVNDAWAAGVQWPMLMATAISISTSATTMRPTIFTSTMARAFQRPRGSCRSCLRRPSMNAYFADFDGDGDLDLFLLTNRLYSPTGYPSERAWERQPLRWKAANERSVCTFFRLVEPPWANPGMSRSFKSTAIRIAFSSTKDRTQTASRIFVTRTRESGIETSTDMGFPR
jgi:hypothetical protein